MAHSPTTITSLILHLLLLLLLLSLALSLASPSLQPEWNTSSKKNSTALANSFAASTSFLSTLRSTLDEIQKVVSIISTFFGPFSGDLCLSSAVSDCLDLLNLSSNELSWTISNSQPSTTSTSVDSGNRHSDLRSWLSATLANQDTYQESLDGTSGVISSLVAGGL